MEGAFGDGAEPQRRTRMRTPMDVVNRIVWDDGLDEADFTVGYEDRFDGLVERPFTTFDWTTELCDAAPWSDQLAIPKHRIWYFKYREYVVWDRRERVDNVFGSCGPERLRIYDVVRDYEQLVQPAVPVE